MNFKLINGMTGFINEKPTLRDINKAIDALDEEASHPFIILEPSGKMEGADFLQALKYAAFSDGSVRYVIETRITNILEQGAVYDSKQYKKNGIKKTAVLKKIFEEYFLHQKAPDISDWEDITDEIRNHKKYEDTFDILDEAAVFHRSESDVLFKCFGIRHNSKIRNVEIYQSVGEAFALLADIVNLGYEYGDFCFSEDKKRIFMEIKIPPNWEIIFSDVSWIRGLISKDNIYLSSFDSKETFIESGIKLTLCFMLVIMRNIVNDDNFFQSAKDYFLNSNYHNFIKVYLDFFETAFSTSYYVVCADSGEFDLTDYTYFSLIYKTIRENEGLS